MLKNKSWWIVFSQPKIIKRCDEVTKAMCECSPYSFHNNNKKFSALNTLTLNVIEHAYFSLEFLRLKKHQLSNFLHELVN